MKTTSSGWSSKSWRPTSRPSTLVSLKSGAGVPSFFIVLAVLTIIGVPSWNGIYSVRTACVSSRMSGINSALRGEWFLARILPLGNRPLQPRAAGLAGAAAGAVPVQPEATAGVHVCQCDPGRGDSICNATGAAASGFVRNRVGEHDRLLAGIGSPGVLSRPRAVPGSFRRADSASLASHCASTGASWKPGPSLVQRKQKQQAIQTRPRTSESRIILATRRAGLVLPFSARETQAG